MALNGGSRIVNFRIELSPPLRPSKYQGYYNKFKHLLNYTNKFALSSHQSSDHSISGFERNYNFYNYLKNQCTNGRRLDVLFHLTCRDLNKINVESRLELLKLAGIRNILLISGEGYQEPDENFRDLYFSCSLELADYMNERYAAYFDSIAVAGYPGETEALDALVKKIRFEHINTIYTQCIFDAQNYKDFCSTLSSNNLEFKDIIPSVALYKDYKTLVKCCKLSRVSLEGRSSGSLIEVDVGNLDNAKSRNLLLKLFKDIIEVSKDTLNPDICINICAFGLFAEAASIIEELGE